MLDDPQLLAQYANEGSDAAFGELVSRYVNLVYSAALRRTGNDPHLAKDVSQMVFTDLARKAAMLSDKVVLAGWLHRATRYSAAQLMRANQRRLLREQEAVAMNVLHSEDSPDWDQLRPLLDDALDQLKQTERDALLLRYFEQLSLADVGHALGASEDTARKKIARALEKVRLYFVRRGVTTTGGALSALLTAHAVHAAPAGLAATLTSASLTGAAGSGGTFAAIKLMATTKLKASVIGAVAIAAVVIPLAWHQAQLRGDNHSLQARAAELAAGIKGLEGRAADASHVPSLALPVPAATVSVSASASNDAINDFIQRMINDGTPPKLTAEQAEAFVNENHRDAESLLAAYRTSGNPALLEEAMQKFPNDPQVAFEAMFKKDSTPEEHRRWLDALKKSAPDNALANYLSALDYFKSGQRDQAVQELLAASAKSQFNDYCRERYQADEEAYRTAGFSEVETKISSSMGILLPQLQQLKDLTIQTIDLATAYRQAGDETSAQHALQMSVSMAQYFDGSRETAGVPLITQLVGVHLQLMALKAMNPADVYGNSGLTVKDRLDQLKQQSDAIKRDSAQFEALREQMSPQDWVNYINRWRAFGEQEAGRWLAQKYASP